MKAKEGVQNLLDPGELHHRISQNLFRRGVAITATESEERYAKAMADAVKLRLAQGFQIGVSDLGRFHIEKGFIDFRVSRALLERVK